MEWWKEEVDWASQGWKKGPPPNMCPPKPHSKIHPKDKRECRYKMKNNQDLAATIDKRENVAATP